MATARDQDIDTAPRGERISPAQAFCLAGGLALVLAGALGFIADATFDAGDAIDGGQFLGLEVNGWHNLVHIASGLLLLAGASRPMRARTICLVFAGAYALVTVWGFVDGNTVFWLLPVNTADNVLHVVLTLGAVAAALATRPADERSVRAHR